MTDDLASINITDLQNKLRERGVVLHESEL